MGWGRRQGFAGLVMHVKFNSRKGLGSDNALGHGDEGWFRGWRWVHGEEELQIFHSFLSDAHARGSVGEL